MRGDRLSRLVLALVLASVAGTTLSAHRRDEYLQAARLAVEPRRVELEIDLTPGIAIAEAIIGDVDRDRDGALSRGEQRDYVERVLAAVQLRVDGQLLHVQSVTSTFPALDAVTRGEGTIRLRAEAFLPRLPPGDHALDFHNGHRPDVSVYLANALVPDGDRIVITAQRRDAAQRDLTIAYVMRDEEGAAMPAWLLGIASALLVPILRRAVVRRRLRMAC